MEDQCSPLSWGYYFQDEGLEELKHSLLYTTLELQTTILSAQEELARKEDEIFQLKNLVSNITRERDEAHEKCQTLMLEKLKLHQQQQATIQHQPNMIHPAILSTSNEDEFEQKKHETSNIQQQYSTGDDCDENFITSPRNKDMVIEIKDRIGPNRPLPEKGKFLKAVMEAGPLLHTLLLAGPLPQWQHPPPQLNTLDIPPVTIINNSCLSATVACGGCCFSKKKRVVENNNEDQGFSDSSPKSNPNKNQKLAHQSSLTNNF